jgi:DNA-binding response OmpR family regulator
MRNNPTILVVDDDPADQFLVQEAMRTANLHYSLRLVSDGEEAIEYLYQTGVNSYIQKPANFDEFTEALRDLSAYWLGRATLPTGPR